MNILLLEDRGRDACYLKDILEEDGHTVFIAQNVSKAKTYWRKERIDCIVADLNMNPEGLKPNERAQTVGGMLTGWIWLRNHVFSKDESMKRRTIIITGYMEELRTHVGDQELKGIALVTKMPLGSAGRVKAKKTVLDHVKVVAKRLENEDR